MNVTTATQSRDAQPASNRPEATRLQEACFVPFFPEHDPDRYRVARLLRQSGRRYIGLSPCGRDVDVALVADHLAPALAEACDARVVAVPPQESLARLVEALRPLRRCAHVLVALSGLRERGEQAAAFDRMDGVLVVARRDMVHERELTSLQAQIGGERSLGILLLG